MTNYRNDLYQNERMIHLHNIERYTNKLQNIYNNLNNQNVKFSLYIPYNSDELEFSSEGVAPFDKENIMK